MERIETTILRNLIFDEEYSRKVIPFIQPDYFENKTEKIIFEESTQFIVKYDSAITVEALNIEMEKGFIKTNELMKTSENGIYAIGDVTDGPWLAHKASHEGILCVDAIKGLKTHKIKKENIPGCTYSRPQIASIGLTEKKALELNHEIKVGKFPFVGNGKAIALGEPEGFIKTIFDKKTGEFLGAHLVGPEVTELIQGFAIAKKLETTEEDLMETIFPHPTLSEAMHESVLDAYDRVIHF